MSDETPQVDEQPEETSVPEASSIPSEPAAAAAPEAAPQSVAAVEEEPEPAKDVETVLCMISKQQVPLSETIELERKKGEVLRIHQRYKKFE